MTRPGRAGITLKYGDTRTYQDRLDEVFPFAWETSAELWSNGEMYVSVTLTMPDGRKLTRGSTGEEDDQFGKTEARAFKRACSAFGLGRFLYPKKNPIAAPKETASTSNSSKDTDGNSSTNN